MQAIRSATFRFLLQKPAGVPTQINMFALPPAEGRNLGIPTYRIPLPTAHPSFPRHEGSRPTPSENVEGCGEDWKRPSASRLKPPRPMTATNLARGGRRREGGKGKRNRNLPTIRVRGLRQIRGFSQANAGANLRNSHGRGPG